ncbi:MAG: M23 family metallopeptidase [Cytophagales bacterium]
MYFYKLLMVLLGFFLILKVEAQNNNKPPDFFKIKTTDLNYIEEDEEEEDHDHDDGDINGDLYGKSGFVDEKSMPQKDLLPRRELSIVSEDTSSINDGELSIVEVEEQIFMDCVWVKVAEHYSIWDSRNINPYKVDGLKIDSVLITLYDTSQFRYWSQPLNSCKTNSDFGFRRIRWHYGIDLDLRIGDSVMSIFDGVVRIRGWDKYGYGNYVVVRHYNGLETLYAHLTRAAVNVGDFVKAGSLLGFGGTTGRSTGPHLHLEFRYAGNPIDPKYFFDFQDCSLKGRIVWVSQSNFEYMKEARKVHFHTIRNGDSLGKIAKRYGVSVTRLCKLNGISTQTKLKIGRKLRIS